MFEAVIVATRSLGFSIACSPDRSLDRLLERWSFGSIASMNARSLAQSARPSFGLSFVHLKLRVFARDSCVVVRKPARISAINSLLFLFHDRERSHGPALDCLLYT